MYRFIFCLGGFCFSVHFDNIGFFRVFKEHYSSFLVKKPVNILLDIEISTKGVRDYCFPYKNGNSVKIEFPKKSSATLDDAVLQIDWRLKTAIASELSKHNFLMLHASCIVSDNKIYAFSGVSGAGKSTTSNIAQKSNYLKPCDDSVLIHMDEKKNKPTVFSTPFIEKEKTYYENNHWELESLHFLIQSKVDKKTKLDKIDAIKNILKNTYLADYEESSHMTPEAFRLAEHIAEKTNCYDLYFTKSSKFLKVTLDD